MTSAGTAIGPPRPIPDHDTEPFWAATTQHHLQIPSCSGCAAMFWPPAPRCPRCLHVTAEWQRVSGRGVLHSWTTVHVDLVGGLHAPWTVVEIELAEQAGLVLTSRLAESSCGEPTLGSSVEVVWTDPEPLGGPSLPYFRLVVSAP